MFIMNQLKLKQLLEQFFIEDIGEQDVTSDTLFPEDSQGTLTFLAKEPGIFSGTDVVKTGFHYLMILLRFNALLKMEKHLKSDKN